MGGESWVILICRVCGKDLEGQEVEAHTARWHPRMCFGGWKKGAFRQRGGHLG